MVKVWRGVSNQHNRTKGEGHQDNIELFKDMVVKPKVDESFHMCFCAHKNHFHFVPKRAQLDILWSTTTPPPPLLPPPPQDVSLSHCWEKLAEQAQIR